MQTSIPNQQAIALPGGRSDTPGNDSILTFTNNTVQTEEYTVTAISIATVITIDGNAVTGTAGLATLAAIAAEMITLINADATVSALVTAKAGSGTDSFIVEGDTPGTAFTGVATTNLDAIVTLIANQAAIAFGKYVTRDLTGTAGGQDKANLPNAATDITTSRNVAGVTVREEVLESSAAGVANTGYPQASPMSVLRQGRIWVTVEDAVVQGGQVFVRYLAASTFTVGSFRSDDPGSEAAALPSAVYDTAAAAGGLAIVALNLP